MRYFLDNSSIITHTLLSTLYSLLSTLYSLLTTPNAHFHLHKAPTLCIRLHHGPVSYGSAFCAYGSY